MLATLGRHVSGIFLNAEAISARLATLYAEREVMRLDAGLLIVTPRQVGSDAALDKQAREIHRKIGEIDKAIAELRDRRRAISPQHASPVAAE